MLIATKQLLCQLSIMMIDVKLVTLLLNLPNIYMQCGLMAWILKSL